MVSPDVGTDVADMESYEFLWILWNHLYQIALYSQTYLSHAEINVSKISSVKWATLFLIFLMMFISLHFSFVFIYIFILSLESMDSEKRGWGKNKEFCIAVRPQTLLNHLWQNEMSTVTQNGEGVLVHRQLLSGSLHIHIHIFLTRLEI